MRLDVGPLPGDALAASAHFHAEILPRVREALSGGAVLTLVFAPAGHEHRGWRAELVASLARAHAPARINALASADEAAIAATLAYLADAPGLTGQYLALDGAGAGPVV
ncbi:hypothetical protein H7F51_09740 [Novosphingobium flavum]|uniref:Short chain dehydrogenase-like proteobacteria domain-containing protein n=1 Tax=Novosphingobium flavum TaxID=1778672 RepID=A0A7X1KM09_9SPHN|nr:hypothetical protein [Novosphingobium flavum]MBC2665805.1 hypothetical protein [Novosphingobium flavum]